MWIWFLGGYALFTAGLAGYSAHVAVSCPDKQRRADAFKVLKLVWGTGTSAGGLAAIVLRLSEANVLP